MANGMKLDRGDIERFVRMIESIKAEVKISSTQLVRTLAEEVKRESIARAPIKTGALEKSHVSEVSGVGGKVRAEIGFGPVFSESGDDYSARMHEGLDLEGMPYNLGPRSEDKSDGTPHRGKGVGMHFLKRAFDYVMRNIKVTAGFEIDKAIVKAARKHGAKVL